MSKILAVIVLLVGATTASAESLSVSLKPAKGLSGTASLNIHEDGSVTVLVYESPTKIEEHTIEVDEDQKEKLRSVVLAALNSYLVKDSFEEIELRDFSVSFLSTKQDVSKSVTSKRLNEAAIKAIKQIFLVVPKMKLSYLDGKI